MEREPSKRVLLVEDDEDTREALEEILSGEGYAVVSASDGLEALARMIGGDVPSLIVLDVMLPEMNGIEFLRARRMHPRLAATPVILLSGMGDDLDGLTGAALNVREFLRKPVMPQRLIDAVRLYS